QLKSLQMPGATRSQHFRYSPRLRLGCGTRERAKHPERYTKGRPHSRTLFPLERTGPGTRAPVPKPRRGKGAASPVLTPETGKATGAPPVIGVRRSSTSGWHSSPADNWGKGRGSLGPLASPFGIGFGAGVPGVTLLRGGSVT
ncbi:hypothetical protein P4O66_015680, partial [Electrophorus voltai]